MGFRGPPEAPLNAFLFIQGLETLSLRVERRVANTEVVAVFLAGHRDVEWVTYPGLTSSQWRAARRSYLPRAAGAVLAFGTRGGAAAGRRFAAPPTGRPLVALGGPGPISLSSYGSMWRFMAACSSSNGAFPDRLSKLGRVRFPFLGSRCPLLYRRLPKSCPLSASASVPEMTLTPGLSAHQSRRIEAPFV